MEAHESIKRSGKSQIKPETSDISTKSPSIAPNSTLLPSLRWPGAIRMEEHNPPCYTRIPLHSFKKTYLLITIIVNDGIMMKHTYRYILAARAAVYDDIIIFDDAFWSCIGIFKIWWVVKLQIPPQYLRTVSHSTV
jgi:hypothetical protein